MPIVDDPSDVQEELISYCLLVSICVLQMREYYFLWFTTYTYDWSEWNTCRWIFWNVWISLTSCHIYVYGVSQKLDIIVRLIRVRSRSKTQLRALELQPIFELENTLSGFAVRETWWVDATSIKPVPGIHETWSIRDQNHKTSYLFLFHPNSHETQFLHSLSNFWNRTFPLFSGHHEHMNTLFFISSLHFTRQWFLSWSTTNAGPRIYCMNWPSAPRIPIASSIQLTQTWTITMHLIHLQQNLLQALYRTLWIPQTNEILY